ncbi:hypothetical protein BR93DRAFT_994968 [Coniochaeta sp. PMI_546]|nr:hypothetical protein BR93DRAFT_994968 [Coniochaeta sp. PMI_546]
MNPNWEEEFDDEIVVYDKLKSLQGNVIPVFYGETVVEDDTRAIVLSDVAETPLALVPPSECNPEDVVRMLETAIRAIFSLGLAPFDAHLLNFLVTHDNRIIVVDHEQDEKLTEEMKGQMDELIQTEVKSIVEEWLKVHTPKKARDLEAEKRANEAWLARNPHVLAIHPLG